MWASTISEKGLTVSHVVSWSCEAKEYPELMLLITTDVSRLLKPVDHAKVIPPNNRLVGSSGLSQFNLIITCS